MNQGGQWAVVCSRKHRKMSTTKGDKFALTTLYYSMLTQFQNTIIITFSYHNLAAFQQLCVLLWLVALVYPLLGLSACLAEPNTASIQPGLYINVHVQEEEVFAFMM